MQILQKEPQVFGKKSTVTTSSESKCQLSVKRKQACWKKAQKKCKLQEQESIFM